MNTILLREVISLRICTSTIKQKRAFVLRLKDPFTQIVNNYGDTFVPTCTAVGKLAKSLKPKVEEVVERKQKPKAIKTSEHKLLPAWYGLLVFSPVKFCSPTYRFRF